MTSLPIPIVVALMLGVLVACNYQQLNETPSGKTFMLMLFTYAGSMVFIGLRWSLDSLELLRIAATLAVISVVLLYLAFRSLGRLPVFVFSTDWPHLLPVVAMLIVALIDPGWTDPLLVLTKLVYALLLIQLVRAAPASMQLTRLDWLRNSEKSLWIAAALLLLSVLVDIAIVVDFAVYDGRHAAQLVSVVNVLGVFLLGWVAVLAGRGAVVQEDGDDAATADTEQSAESPPTTAASQQLLSELNRLLIDQELYKDSQLNLQKLARKAGIPAREISRTINTLTGQNVSQWVNQARVEAVCNLLTNPSVTVTRAMNEAGFITKSNFNREFKRITGKSPSDWRQHPV